MRIVPFIIPVLLLFFAGRFAGHPHGPDFRISCSKCHSSKGWQLDKAIYSFNHDSTKMKLRGQHSEINCRDCHKTLVFNQAPAECSSCHNDVHQGTTGLDCSRCHNSSSWLVNNITEIHQRGRFPLLGAHRMADCSDCHISENLVRFDVLGVNCIDCHRDEYTSTTNPNHIQAGFSEDCSSCHPVNAFQWAGAGFNHSFFPLVQGHSQPVCADCHKTGNYSDASPDCYSCHKQDYTLTRNPNHTTLGFPVTCELCHTLAPGWIPASYREHDSNSFPIYSGKHKGTWDSCTECHTNPSNYKVFTCLSCHEHNKATTDKDHNEVRGYTYDSNACYKCHPAGRAED